MYIQTNLGTTRSLKKWLKMCTLYHTYSLVYCCYLTNVKNINKSLVNIINVFIIRIFILLNRKEILNSLYLNTALGLEWLDNIYTIYIYINIYTFIFQTWQHYIVLSKQTNCLHWNHYFYYICCSVFMSINY